MEEEKYSLERKNFERSTMKSFFTQSITHVDRHDGRSVSVRNLTFVGCFMLSNAKNIPASKKISRKNGGKDGHDPQEKNQKKTSTR